MSFYNKSLPNPYDSGYAIPEYVRAEPPGRGAFTTQWLPRGTISQVIPDFLAKPATPKSTLDRSSLSGSSLGGCTLAGHSLAGSSLGNTRGDEDAAGASDPVASFGQKAASAVLAGIASLPPKDRAQALELILKEIRTGLLEDTNRRVAIKAKRGMSQQAALKSALAESLSEGLLKELVDLGTGKKTLKGKLLNVPRKARGQEPLSGLFGDIKGAVTGAVKGVVGTVSDLTCAVVGSPATSLAAGGAAISYGAPPQAGVAGAQMAQGICASGTAGGAVYPHPPPSTTPEWLLPVAIGGGALLLVLALRR